MKSVFIDKMCSILIVHSSESVRIKIQQTLRGLGYTNFKACESIPSARKYIKIHTVDWVLTTLFAQEKESAIQLLYYLKNDRQAAQIYVSLFLRDEEESVLPLAFELGILSSHKDYFETDTLRNVVLKISELATQANYDATVVAAHYHRAALIRQRRLQTLLQTTRQVAEFAPDRGSLLVAVAEAQFLNGRVVEANDTLMKAHLLDPDLSEEIAKLRNTYLPNASAAASHEAQEARQPYRINSVMIVDPDEGSNIAMRSVFSQLNIENIVSFNDGQSAWDWIKDQPKVDLVVMEWKLRKLAGPFLVQRIRALEHGTMPILVVSSLLKADDATLLEEFSIAKTVEKPIDAERFSNALQWCIEQENSPEDQVILERKIYTALAGDRMIEAAKLKKEFEKHAKISPDRKKYMDARFNYHFGNYTKAKADLVAAAKHAKGESIAITNLLGKCHLRLGEFRPALNLFQKAHHISPQNIERLCKIAEVFLYLDELSAAEKTIESAEKLDAQNPHVKVVRTEIAAFKNNLDAAFGIIGKANNINHLVAFLNNHAVAKTRAGERKEGIEMYQSVLKILEPTERQNISKVYYNLGLAYVRSGELEPALGALNNAAAADRYISVKAVSLLKRVEEAIKNKTGFVKLNEEKQQGMMQDLDSEIDFDNYEESIVSESGVQQPTVKILCLRGVVSFRDEFEGLSVSLNRDLEKVLKD